MRNFSHLAKYIRTTACLVLDRILGRRELRIKKRRLRLYIAKAQKGLEELDELFRNSDRQTRLEIINLKFRIQTSITKANWHQ